MINHLLKIGLYVIMLYPLGNNWLYMITTVVAVSLVVIMEHGEGYNKGHEDAVNALKKVE